jgi:hypothetical protein
MDLDTRPCERCGEPRFHAEATGESVCSNVHCPLSVVTTYRCVRCNDTRTCTGYAAETHCRWGRCNGIARPIRTLRAPPREQIRAEDESIDAPDGAVLELDSGRGWYTRSGKTWLPITAAQARELLAKESNCPCDQREMQTRRAGAHLRHGGQRTMITVLRGFNCAVAFLPEPVKCVCNRMAMMVVNRDGRTLCVECDATRSPTSEATRGASSAPTPAQPT